MWYYARGEEQIGPIEEGAFRILVDQRIVGPSTLVWREGMEAWVAYQEIAGTVTDWGTPCSECGRPHVVEELLEFEGKRVCADCKDLFFQRLREGNTPEGALVYAGIFKRFCALVIDSLVVNVVNIPLGIVGMLMLASAEMEYDLSDGAGAFGILVLMAVLTAWMALYFTWFVGRFGATPGKMMLGIKIVRPDGARISYKRAFGRFLAHQLSGAIFYIGYIIACFDDQRRGLHDHICDTRVVEKR